MELINLDNLMTVLDEYGREVRNIYQDRLITSDRIASGGLLNSIEYIVEHSGTQYTVSLKLQHYWKYVEDDTKPHWPPLKKLLEWIQVKPVIPRPDSRGRIPKPEQLAFLIGRKIAREGTKGSHDLQDALDEVNARYRDRFAVAFHKDTSTLMKVLLGQIRGSMPPRPR